jgi:hypothetical protein
MHHTGINEEVDIRPTRLGSKGSMIAFTVQGIAKQLGVEEKILEEWTTSDSDFLRARKKLIFHGLPSVIIFLWQSQKQKLHIKALKIF